MEDLPPARSTLDTSNRVVVERLEPPLSCQILDARKSQVCATPPADIFSIASELSNAISDA